MVVQEYDASWPERFERLKAAIAKSLSRYLAIEHVGSTSIPGMCAKPIIDIDVVIEKADDFETARDELIAAGYLYVGDMGIPGREAFRRRASGQKAPPRAIDPLDEIEHHLYVCAKGNRELDRHLRFRDALRRDENLRREYRNIKLEILGKVGFDNRDGYAEMKEDQYKWFFEKVLDSRNDPA
jgi:GrpB-like predicted nucleotidyltransferase (UPF0157 family)